MRQGDCHLDSQCVETMISESDEMKATEENLPKTKTAS